MGEVKTVLTIAIVSFAIMFAVMTFVCVHDAIDAYQRLHHASARDFVRNEVLTNSIASLLFFWITVLLAFAARALPREMFQ